jgi:hypothetical protein
MNYCKQDFVDALYVFSAHFIQFTAFQPSEVSGVCISSTEVV